MDDLYYGLQVIHVLAAVVWLGGAAGAQFLAARALKAGADRTVYVVREIEWLGNHVFLPSSLIVLAMGIWMTIRAEAVAFGDFWIIFGIVGIVSTALFGSLFLGPESGRIGKLIEERGPDDPEVTRRIKRIIIVSRVDLFILLLVLVNMVVKPGSPVA